MKELEHLISYYSNLPEQALQGPVSHYDLLVVLQHVARALSEVHRKDDQDHASQHKTVLSPI